ncbi:MAG: hypothetical protein IBJ07_20750 [Rhizobiaceae bacterium]|nr:hypothetical protein [Rhizobiaceae bacterium]
MTRDDLLTFDGVTQSITEWALDYGITPETIMQRLRVGMTISKAITKPMRVKSGFRLPDFSTKPYGKHQQPKLAPKAKLYTHNGISKTLTEWSVITGWSYRTLVSRIRSGMAIEKALSQRTPSGRLTTANARTINGVSMTLAEWADYAGISHNTLQARLRSRSLAEAVAMSRPLPSPSNRPGVVSNLPASKGTGAGSAAQEIAEITFPESEASR